MQSEIYKLLSDQPQTQKQLVEVTRMSTKQVSHELNCLIKKGMVQVRTLEIARRPKGYTRMPKAPERHPFRWPRF
jgi:DNA-binding MarR family transcriptional regulator